MTKEQVHTRFGTHSLQLELTYPLLSHGFFRLLHLRNHIASFSVNVVMLFLCIL